MVTRTIIAIPVAAAFITMFDPWSVLFFVVFFGFAALYADMSWKLSKY